MAIRSVYLSNIVRAENRKNSPEINYYGAGLHAVDKELYFRSKEQLQKSII